VSNNWIHSAWENPRVTESPDVSKGVRHHLVNWLFSASLGLLVSIPGELSAPRFQVSIQLDFRTKVPSWNFPHYSEEAHERLAKWNVEVEDRE
jgi:hypothetical protein